MTTGTSPVTWGIALLAVYNGLQSIVGQLPPTWNLVVNAIVAVLTIVLHKNQIVAGKAR